MMQENNDIQVELSEPQAAVLECRQSTILDMSGQGGGKSAVIAYDSGNKVAEFPEALGFIGANTHMQLTHSTLVRVFKIWKQTYGFTEYHPKSNRSGAFVYNKRPPAHFERLHELPDYDGIISFYNGAVIFTGSLENYKAHDGKEFAWAHLDETKDTKEQALTDVIMGRLRQYGLWYREADGEIFFNARITADQAEAMGWKAWNPLYIHTSPAGGTVAWLNMMFKLDRFTMQIRNAVEAEDRDFFYKEFDNKAVCIYSAYHNQHNLPPDYFEKKKMDYNQDSAKILKLIHGYPFSKTGGEYYPFWNRDRHVGQVPYLPGVQVHISWDFNVVPFMTCICLQLEFLQKFIDDVGVKHDKPAPGYKPIEVIRVRVYKGYFLKSPRNSTEAVCVAFSEDHDPNVTEVLYYGDASGNSRIPGLGAVTNYKIMADALWQYLHNSSKQVQIPNIGIGKRKDFINDVLAGKYPEIELIVDESLTELIEDMEHTKEGAKGKVKELTKDENTGERFEKRGHPSDALEYVVTKIFKHYLTF